MTSAMPSLSIVVPNVDGRAHLDPFFEALHAQPEFGAGQVECLFVDNGSRDGSVARAEAETAVRVLRNEVNRGFSAACNQGARASGSDIVCFLNNDVRVGPGFLARLVAPILRGETVSTTARMLGRDGRTIDFAGGGMNFHGIGIAKGHGEAASEAHERPGPSLFPCGGAMAIDRQVFLEAGGFDEAFFAYYEDVDLGWRLWLQGHDVLYVPEAVCRHEHASTSARFPSEMIRLLQVRNPLLACFKNYDDENLKRVFPAALALAMRRMQLVSGVDPAQGFRIEQTGPGRAWVARLRGVLERLLRPRASMRREAMADFLALGDLLGDWDGWMARRLQVQSKRRRSDAEIFERFEDPFWCIEDEPSYRALHDGLVEFFELRKRFPGTEG